MIEDWKPIPSHTGYEVSSFGRIRHERRGLLKPWLNAAGYYQISFYKGGYRSNHLYVARLVAQAFIPNPKNKPEVNHIDGDPKNNYVTNLEWCTHRENIHHAWRTGLCTPSKGWNGPPSIIKKGEKNSRCKLTDKQVRIIKHALSFKVCGIQQQLAKMMKISQTTISEIKRGLTRKEIIT